MLKGFAEKCATAKVGQVEDVVEGYLMCLKNVNLTGVLLGVMGGIVSCRRRGFGERSWIESSMYASSMVANLQVSKGEP
jgi:hypothetical protein